jgi:aminoglycoside 6'-N-acetyltransferase I
MSDERLESAHGSTGAHIRLFKSGDAHEWRRLRHILWPETTEEDHAVDLAECLQSPATQVILVAELAPGRLAGMAEIRIRSHADGCHTSPVGYLEGWIVDLAHRRCGIGRRLVEAAGAWSRAHGCREFASDALIENSASRAAHRALGFHEGSEVVCFCKTLVNHFQNDFGSPDCRETQLAFPDATTRREIDSRRPPHRPPPHVNSRS